MSASARVSRSVRPPSRWAGLTLAALVLAAVSTVIAEELATTTPIKAGLIIGVAIVGWILVVSPRIEVSLAIFMLYLGVADGYLKLKTNSSVTTLGRDVLLYAIAIGALARAWMRREPIRFPPLSGWVFAWLVVVLVQVLNPHEHSAAHALASLRPHLEFVPLFFLAAFVMRTRKRLRWFLILLLVIANANAVAGIAQFGDSPAQLAAWGPGYAAKVYGTGSVSGRTFVDSAGVALVRPFALGADFGFGGIVGDLAAPAMVALLMLSSSLRSRLLALCLAPGVFLAIITSDARTALIGGVVSLAAFALLSTAGRNGGRVVVGLVVVSVLGYGAISAFAGSHNSAEFSRYSSITPGSAASTSYDYRKATLAKIPVYAREFPFGEGIGSAGPAAQAVGGPATGGLDAEGQINYLLIEVGIPGALVLIGFTIRLMVLSLRGIRRTEDPALRVLLTGLAAPIFTLFLLGFVGITSATSPGAPYLWFAAGTLAYWLGDPHRDAGAAEDVASLPSRPASLALPPVSVPA